MILEETVRITTRTSVEVPFFKWSDDFILYVEQNFVNTNKIIHYTIQVSEDGLTETRTGIWGSEEYYMDFVNIGNTYKEWENRESYNLSNGIIDDIRRISRIDIKSIDESVTINTTDYYTLPATFSPVINFRSVVS